MTDAREFVELVQALEPAFWDRVNKDGPEPIELGLGQCWSRQPPRQRGGHTAVLATCSMH